MLNSLRAPSAWAVRGVVWGLAVLLCGLAAPGGASPAAPTLRPVKYSGPHFRVSSFNLLGYGHTVRSRRYADGRTRMAYAVKILNRRDIDVVGFQEFQPEQRSKFMRLTGRQWAHYPGDALRNIDMNNSIAWRTGTWKLVEKHTIGIPYFGGEKVRMPYLLLRHRDSGRRVWFANFHNPADAHGNAERYRDAALRREIRLARRLHDTGIPVIFTGDMNEREEYFCRLTRHAPMKAAQGGSHGAASACRPPDWPTRRPGVEYIFGSTQLHFSNYQRRTGRLVSKTTDHPVILADVTLPRR
jgi:endonuclease/exonuclease/phosphatase family metal-dependent hydrolase